MSSPADCCLCIS